MKTTIAACATAALLSTIVSAQDHRRGDLGVRQATFTSSPGAPVLPGFVTFAVDFRVNWPRLTFELGGYESDQYIELRMFDLAPGAPDPDFTPQSDPAKPRQPVGFARISARYDRDLPAGSAVHLAMEPKHVPAIAANRILYIVPLYVKVVPVIANKTNGTKVSLEETALEIGVGRRYVRTCNGRTSQCSYRPVGR